MKIKLFYFAKVREILGIDREEIDVEDDIKTLAELVAFLKMRGSKWQSILEAHPHTEWPSIKSW